MRRTGWAQGLRAGAEGVASILSTAHAARSTTKGSGDGQIVRHSLGGASASPPALGGES